MADKSYDPFRDPTSIGNIILTAFGITPMQLSEAIQFHKSNQDIMLGDAMVRLGMISREQLEEALDRQKVLRADASEVIDIAIARTNEITQQLDALHAIQRQALFKLAK